MELSTGEKLALTILIVVIIIIAYLLYIGWRPSFAKVEPKDHNEEHKKEKKETS